MVIFLCCVVCGVKAQDGTIDSTFGTNGVLSTNSNIIPNNTIQFKKAACLGNGKIIQAGLIRSNIKQDSNVFIGCYNTNGSIDTTFGQNGFLSIGDTLSNTSTHSLLITRDDKILIGARCIEGGNSFLLLIKLNADGTFDNSFGTNGQAKISASVKNVKKLLVQSTGKILMHVDTFLYRFTAAGSIDPTFGSASKLIVGNANAIEVTPSDKIYIAESNRAISISRYLPNGEIDPDFASYYHYVPAVNNGAGEDYEYYSPINLLSDSFDNIIYNYIRFSAYVWHAQDGAGLSDIVFQKMSQAGILDSAYTYLYPNGNSFPDFRNRRILLLPQSNGKFITFSYSDAISIESVAASRWYQNPKQGKDVSFSPVSWFAVDGDESAFLCNDSSLYIFGTQSAYLTSKLLKVKTSLNSYQPHKPIAKVWVDKNKGTANSTVFQFRDSSEHGVLERKWTFSPNNQTYECCNGSTSQNVQVRFTQNGKYSVKLVVSNIAGVDSITMTDWIEIGDKPTAKFDVTNNLSDTNMHIGLLDSSLNNPTQWKWVISPPNAVFEQGTSDTSQNPFVRFTQSGFYSVKLVASSAFGVDSLTKQNIITVVYPSGPIADFEVDKQFAGKGMNVTLTDKSTSSLTNRRWHISPNTYTYVSGDSTSLSPIVQFNEIGNYSIGLVVSNIYGTDSIMRTNFIDIGELPQAIFGANKTSGIVGDTIQFIDSSLNATSHTWEITPNTYTHITGDLFQFNAAGVYSVKLVVSNSYGTDTLLKENYITIMTVGLSELEEREVVSIYPNPASNEVNIVMKENNSNTIFELFNSIGERIELSSDSIDNYRINTSDLANGVYFLRIQNAGNSYFKKLIINH